MRNKLKTFHTVIHSIGTLLIILGIILLIPIIVFIINKEYMHGYNTFFAFIIPCGLSLVLGFILKIFFKKYNPNVFQAMIICSLSWLLFSMIGALVFVIGIESSYLNGLFETMSGFTTTGITMYSGLDKMPGSILFWRSLIQWVGGLGILTFILAVTSLHSSAHQLYGAEGHKISIRRPVPGLANTIKIFWLIYTSLTIFIMVSLLCAGMSFFDSLCHGLTTLSTGGFSPHDASIEYYRLTGYKNYILIEYIIIFGMFLGGTNFLIHYFFLKRDFKSIKNNTEIKYWISIIFIFIFLLFIERLLNFQPLKKHIFLSRNYFIELEKNIRTIIFQVISIITTTGFSTKEIGSPFFGHLARSLFLIMMFTGGCVGSTGGGFKILRISILYKLIKREVGLLTSSRSSIKKILINKRVIDNNEIYRLGALFFIWIIFLITGGVITILFSDFDGITSFSGMFSALGNIGPCYISVNEMILLSPVIKIVYIIGMLAGRLEILPVLLLFNYKAWKA